MTFLDAIASLWDWSPLDWGNQVKTIWKTSMSQKKSGSFEQNIKTVLSWVVVSRAVIAHIYTFTYIPNLYSILMWCQRRLLLPWMVMSAFKNFILEVIVFIVVVLLYIEGNISDFLFGGIIIEKLISLGLAAHNWLTINAFYMQLKELDQRKLMRLSQRTASTFNLMIGMSMRHSITLDETDPKIRKRQRFISVSNFDNLAVESSTGVGEETRSIRISRSLNTISMLSIRYFDHGDSIFNADGSRLSISEKVITILGISHNYVENLRLSELNRQSGAYLPLEIQEEDSDISCDCPSDGKSSLESDSQGSSKVQSIENYSGWTEQWTMTNILDNPAVVDVDKVSSLDKSCQYSEGSCSFEESISSLETETPRATYLVRDSVKVQENSPKNVLVEPNDEIFEASEEDKAIFATWIRDLVYVGIHKKEAGLFEDSDSHSRKSVLKDTGTNCRSSTVVQRHTQTETLKWENNNQVNFVTVQNLTLPRDPNGWAEFGSGLRKKKSIEKAKKEDRELEALKVYNEKTLWRYKRLMDLEKLKPIPVDMIFKDEKKAMKKTNLDIKISHKKDLQKGKELDKVKAVENIPALFASEKSEKVSLSLPEKKSGDLKTRIAQIDWTFPSVGKNLAHKFEYKQTVFDLIDDRDTATLLQSAFSFDNYEFRGFPLGPREFYSVRSDRIPNVFEEIIKAARISVIRHDCPNYSTLEIDYGDDYLKDLETFGEKHQVCKTEVSRTEIVRNNNDIGSQMQDAQVILIEHWVKKYKEIVSSKERNLEELARLPGFSLLKKLIGEIDSMVSESVESEESAESVNSTPEIGHLDSENLDVKVQFFQENVELIDDSKPADEIHPSIFDDQCNWSDESATYLNFGEDSETSLGNGSNMSEFSVC